MPDPTSPPVVGRGLAARAAARALRLFGWRLVAERPLPAKCVMLFYPHTSNWDFPVGLVAKWALELDARWVAKASLFRGPMGIVMRYWGGIPVNRRAPGGIADRLAREFARAPALCLALTPEGTRSRTEGWKSGFYRIATAAEVPFVLAFIDYRRREIGYGGAFMPTGERAADMARIADFYADKTGRRPECQGPVRLLGNDGG